MNYDDSRINPSMMKPDLLKFEVFNTKFEVFNTKSKSRYKATSKVSFRTRKEITTTDLYYKIT